jgi:hypothetical protein
MYWPVDLQRLPPHLIHLATGLLPPCPKILANLTFTTLYYSLLPRMTPFDTNLAFARIALVMIINLPYTLDHYKQAQQGQPVTALSTHLHIRLIQQARIPSITSASNSSAYPGPR